jgi:hypothetical protein
MNKIKKALLIATVVGAVGVSYAVYTLSGMPDFFDMEDDDE